VHFWTNTNSERASGSRRLQRQASVRQGVVSQESGIGKAIIPHGVAKWEFMDPPGERLVSASWSLNEASFLSSKRADPPQISP
jgi:hypothetical protein